LVRRLGVAYDAYDSTDAVPPFLFWEMVCGGQLHVSKFPLFCGLCVKARDEEIPDECSVGVLVVVEDRGEFCSQLQELLYKFWKGFPRCAQPLHLDANVTCSGW
jgi:hypothetical protein